MPSLIFECVKITQSSLGKEKKTFLQRATSQNFTLKLFHETEKVLLKLM